MGARHRRTYRFVAIESRNARDGKYLESLGNYDPRTKSMTLDLDRTAFWLDNGAQLSNTVAKLVARYRKEQETGAQAPETVAGIAAAAADAGTVTLSPEAAAEREEKIEAPAEMAVAASETPEPPATDTEPAADENEDVASSG